MTQLEFWVKVGEQRRLHHDWRDGQTLFNTLVTHRPDISETIRATPNDPFFAYDIHDPRYMSACKVIDLLWDEV